MDQLRSEGAVTSAPAPRRRSHAAAGNCTIYEESASTSTSASAGNCAIYEESANTSRSASADARSGHREATSKQQELYEETTRSESSGPAGTAGSARSSRDGTARVKEHHCQSTARRFRRGRGGSASRDAHRGRHASLRLRPHGSTMRPLLRFVLVRRSQQRWDLYDVLRQGDDRASTDTGSTR